MPDLVSISKRLSYILRHNPNSVGVTLEEGGWLPVESLLKGAKIDMVTLEKVVADNNKKRFEFNNDRSKIRARQGHSVQVELGYTPVKPPDILFHGTVFDACPSIFREGLTKQNRHHVHLSEDRSTAYKVGSRRGSPVILYVDAERMSADGHQFFVTENGVWLTEHVPTEYITTRVKFARTSDGKEFFIILESHWSDVLSKDGEKDSIKWYGGDNYVGASSGYTYRKL